MGPLAVLKGEHALFRRVLDSMDLCASRIERGGNQRDLPRFVLLLRAFVDGWHGPKEEKALFDVMVRHGFSATTGPLPLMAAEHMEAHRMLEMLATLIAEGRMEEPSKVRMVLQALRSVEYLLRYHMDMEEAVVYPAAEAELPPEAIRMIEERLKAGERGGRVDITGGAIRRLAHELQILYPIPTLPALAASA
ncbi:MAG: hemerythrin domain-containing protein [Deltaproteobacteria bacterium]|nr:hemerythrin domain-containing protein [Deltaproteobacteria bacterium]